MRKLFTKENILLAVILIAAAFLRLYKIADYMTFLGDEGRDVLVAYNILHGHFTLLGPTASVGGFFFGPLYYYMMVPFLWLFRYDPVGPAVMIGILGTITVWLVYKIGKELFNNAVGMIAALLYAIAPVIIMYSRSSWNPNPIPFFSLLLIYFLYKGVTLKKSWQFFLVGILWGINVELHFVTGILAIVIFGYMIGNFLLFENKKDWKYLLLIPGLLVMVGFSIAMLPYLGFEVRHGFPNVKNFYTFIFHSGKVNGQGNVLGTLGNVFLRLFGRLLINAPSIENVSKVSQSLVLAYVLPTILGLASIGLLFKQIYKAFHKKEIVLLQKLLLMGIWLLGGIIVFGFYKKLIYDYYFGFMYAVPFLLVANLFVILWKRHLVLKGIAVIVGMYMIVVNLLGIPFRYAPNKQLLQTKRVATVVLELAHNQPYNFALITGGNSDHAYRYFLTLWGHPPVTIENQVIDPQRKTVTTQLIVVCESLPCGPLGYSLWEIAGFGRAEIDKQIHFIPGVIDLYKLSHYKGA